MPTVYAQLWASIWLDDVPWKSVCDQCSICWCCRPDHCQHSCTHTALCIFHCCSPPISPTQSSNMPHSGCIRPHPKFRWWKCWGWSDWVTWWRILRIWSRRAASCSDRHRWCGGHPCKGNPRQRRSWSHSSTLLRPRSTCYWYNPTLLINFAGIFDCCVSFSVYRMWGHNCLFHALHSTYPLAIDEFLKWLIYFNRGMSQIC